MKKINALLVSSLVFICASTSVFAEELKSDDQIVGNWLLEYTKKSPQEGDAKTMGITWVLKDHQLVQKGIPQARGDAYDSAPVEYTIENGHLKVGVPGRAGKFDEYSLEERTDTKMVLKDVKFGTLFYFTKK